MRRRAGRRTAVLCGLCGLLPCASGEAGAQAYPARPVRILTAEPGGGSDIASRIVAPALTARLGQQVIVENRVGGVILSELAAKATPDGHTLLIYSNALWLLPFMRTETPYAVSDFAPLSLLVSAPALLTVHPSVPAQSAQELIALARAKPGALSYASGPIGASPHLAGELFKAMAGVDILHVPFKGVGLALNDVIAGRVNIMFPSTGSATQHVKAGRLRALAVTSAQPSPLAPGLPTLASAGVPGYELLTIFGLFVPARTPASVVSRLQRDAVAAMHAAEVKQRFDGLSMETVGSSPAEFMAVIRGEMDRLGKVIRERGIRAPS
jgi:tripartite-type tricarboxylate transporter receptor subunit TctC